MPMAPGTLHFAVFAISSFALLVASVPSEPPTVFKVGDARGWTVPANGTETYNHWAKRNRFQVGNVLSFTYASNDSVLLVSHDDYKQCSTETPERRFASGDTEIMLDRYGPMYFVSGAAGHCEAGQRMIVRVRAASALYSTAPAPAPAAVSGRGGAPSPTPVSSAPAALPSVGSGAGSTSPTTPSPSPSPLPQASGASRRVLGVVPSVAVGLAVLVAVITVSVVV